MTDPERIVTCPDGKQVELTLHNHQVVLVSRPEIQEEPIDYQNIVGLQVHHASFHCSDCGKNLGCTLQEGLSLEQKVILHSNSQSAGVVGETNFSTITVVTDETQIPRIEGFTPQEPQKQYPPEPIYLSTRP